MKVLQSVFYVICMLHRYVLIYFINMHMYYVKYIYMFLISLIWERNSDVYVYTNMLDNEYYI